MVALAGHLMRLSWGGNAFVTDSWTNTLHFDSPNTDQPDSAAMLAALTNLTSLTNGASEIGWWKYNEVSPATGKYVSATSNTHELSPVLQGGRSITHPQLTLVASLLTDAKRGPAHAGRVYLPYAPPVDGAGLVSATDVAFAQDQFALFVKAVVATKTHLPIVWSAQYKQAGIIRRVAVGRVVDTQRRRRKSLPEGRGAGTPVTGL